MMAVNLSFKFGIALGAERKLRSDRTVQGTVLPGKD